MSFNISYNFINENSDINYVTTKDCINLTKVRDMFNRFNDTIHHKQYVPLVKEPIDHLTYQIRTWLIVIVWYCLFQLLLLFDVILIN